MKKLVFTIVAAALSVVGVQAQTSATTTPVGYYTVSALANSDSTLSVSLTRDAEVETVAVSISANVITASISSISNAQWDAPLPGDSVSDTYYLVVREGSLEGRYYTVLSNTGTDGSGNVTITVDPNSVSDLETQGFAGTEQFVIFPYWTLATLFPNGDGIGVNLNPFAVETSISFFNPLDPAGVNKPASLEFFYVGVGNILALTPGWYDGTLALVDNKTVAPEDAMRIRNQTGTTTFITVTGTVPATRFVTEIDTAAVQNDNNTVNPYPIDLSPAQSKLFESGVVDGTLNPFAPVDTVLLYTEPPSGFNVFPANAIQYVLPGNILALTPGWYDGTLSPVDNSAIIQTGRNLIIRKAGGAVSTDTWTAELPYTP